MKIETTPKTINPNDWWSNEATLNHIYEKDFPCNLAEHRYLVFFLALLELSSSQKNQQLKKIVRPAEIFPYQSDREKILAKAIPKIKISHGKSFFKNAIIHPGQKSYLLLTSNLAGTIAAEEKISNSNSYVLRAKRPLSDDSDIIKLIEFDKIVYDEFPHQIELLEKAKSLVIRYQYIPAILYCLRELNIEHDARTIMKNSRKLTK